MNEQARQAILVAIDALESCEKQATFFLGETEWQEDVFDEDKVEKALSMLQSLDIEETVEDVKEMTKRRIIDMLWVLHEQHKHRHNYFGYAINYIEEKL